MTDVPQHIREAMARLAAVRDLALDESGEWLKQIYPDHGEHYHTDDLRTVAYFFIDSQREFDT